MKLSTISAEEILQARGPKNRVIPNRPYAFLVEDERSASGQIEPVATLFLTNRECPFRCLYCDLWKNTTAESVLSGQIPEQIAYALSRLPAATHIKLYNSGNFFDAKAIPEADHALIAEQVQTFRTVIVENHPSLTDERVLAFRDRIPGEFEIAMGLETIHPRVLPRLNKGMTLADFDRAAMFLRRNSIEVRTFILLKPPFLEEDEGIEWALRSVEHALDQGIRVCCIIPTRDGNGIMEQLRAQGLYSPPQLRSLELVQHEALKHYASRGRVFVDLWDAQRFASCPHCVEVRIARMHRMNLSQAIEPNIHCPECR